MAVQKTRWPSLAQDLAVLSIPGSPLDIADIYRIYNTTETEVAAMLTDPEFRKLVVTASRRFEAYGDKAAAVYRASTLAQGVSEKLYNDFMAGDVKPQDAVKFLELLYRASGLDSGQKGPQVAVQNNMTVQLPSPAGLTNPKFNHLLA